MKNIILTLTGVLWLFSPSVIAGAGHESGGCGSAIPCTPTNGNPYSQGPIRYGAPAKSNSGNNGKGHKNSQSGRGGPNNQKISGAYGGIPTGPQLQHRTTKRDVRQLFTRQPEFAFIDPRGSIGGGADPFGVDMDAEGELQTGQSQIQETETFEYQQVFPNLQDVQGLQSFSGRQLPNGEVQAPRR